MATRNHNLVKKFDFLRFYVDCLFLFIFRNWEMCVEIWASKENIFVYMVTQRLKDFFIKEEFSELAQKEYNTKESYKARKQHLAFGHTGWGWWRKKIEEGIENL